MRPTQRVRVRGCQWLPERPEAHQCGDVLYVPAGLMAELVGLPPADRAARLAALTVTFWPGLSIGGEGPLVRARA